MDHTAVKVALHKVDARVPDPLTGRDFMPPRGPAIGAELSRNLMPWAKRAVRSHFIEPAPTLSELYANQGI